MSTRLVLDPPPPFDFAATAYSHGWVLLAPSAWDAEGKIVRRVEKLATGQVVLLDISGSGTLNPSLNVEVHHAGVLTPAEAGEVKRKVGHMFRLDEDLSEFYALCAAHGSPWAAAVTGLGRMLRSPTLFEDIIKTIATTNTQWGGTIKMIAALVDALGEPYFGDPTRRAFPTPEAVAAAPPETFTQVARFGYRGPYVAGLAQKIVTGEFDPEALLHSDIPTPELKKELLANKGVGPYAAATLLMLIGRYDEIGYDTVFRDFVSARYFNGERPSPQEMMAVYDDWGRWRYLAYWTEMWLADSGS